MSINLCLDFSDPIRAAEMAFERAAEAAARAAERAEEEEEEDSGPKPILPYSSFFILSSTNPWEQKKLLFWNAEGFFYK